MADTGAPWNIPYAEPSDLVRDWPALSEDVAEAVAAGLTSVSVVRQIKQVITTTDFTTSSTTAVDLTGVSVSITPQSATNRILLQFVASQEQAGSNSTNFYQFRRDTTDMFEEVSQRGPGSTSVPLAFAMTFDESAGSTSARTYSIRTRVSNQTLNVFNSSLVVIEYTP